MPKESRMPGKISALPRYLFEAEEKHLNNKRYYKIGNLSLKDNKRGTVLSAQAQVYDRELILYLHALDVASDGNIKPAQVIGMLASLAHKAGLRLDSLEI